MHQVYTTEAFVFSLRPAGEGSAMVRVYTRELGFLSAWVQSARSVKSKLRFRVQPFSHLTVSLVRGRDMWRVVGVTDTDDEVRVRTRPHCLPVVSRVSQIFSRLLAGEERDAVLFDDFRNGLSALLAVEVQNAVHVEIMLLLRALNHLGYVSPDPVLLPFVSASRYGEIPESDSQLRAHAVRAINQALRESQL